MEFEFQNFISIIIFSLTFTRQTTKELLYFSVSPQLKPKSTSWQLGMYHACDSRKAKPKLNKAVGKKKKKKTVQSKFKQTKNFHFSRRPNRKTDRKIRKCKIDIYILPLRKRPSGEERGTSMKCGCSSWPFLDKQ